MQEECKDLYERMRNGLLKQPTVVSFLCMSHVNHREAGRGIHTHSFLKTEACYKFKAIYLRIC